MPPAALYERARNWAIESDPGLLRLQLAARTTIALGVALGLLYLLTRVTHQPLTVALLGAVIAMVSARSVNDPDPRQQRITLALLPLPAAAAITAAAVLAPHRIAADAVFVVIIFAAVYIRRFGGRGVALGMVAFMAYFFTLFFRAGTAELPWLIVAVAVGTLCSFVMSSYVLPDRPERVLRRTVASLRARMAVVVDTAADAVRTGRFDERRRHQLRVRVARLNETALMVHNQIEDKVDPALVWPGVGGGELALRLFDAELTVERVAAAAARAAAVDIPGRAELAEALAQLAFDMRAPGSGGLRRAAELARSVRDLPDAGVQARRLAMAILDTAAAGSAIRAMIERAAAEGVEAGAPLAVGADAEEQPRRGLRPTTRQAIQVTIAATLAIVVGELVSPARWYWAVITAFVTFAGTTSWGETLTKGWQRLLGTVLGVPSGVLVATLVSGHDVVALVLIFVCLFCAVYLMKVAYSLMIFWITTMLALLYGLLGQFSVDLLLLRIEETAIGAVIGVTVALLVLPTRTGTSIRNDARAFLTALSELIATCVAALADDDATAGLTEQARGLDRKLQQFRDTAKPRTVGVAGLGGRRSIKRGLRLLTACDHYARALARASVETPTVSTELADAVAAAAAQTRRNIGALVATLDQREAPDVMPATDLLDAVDTLVGPDSRRLLGASHALRQIDRAVVDAAVDLGAGQITLW
ncbi:FUSC family protein [Mycobacterium talmoniae]|uniref:FUSC family protein n=1 Tax=Mycobacterium talmoniae TaxID=1858794 RepID=UPI0009F682F7|nr:FUSC family protein [Mycobacterium talmoniae]